MAKRPKRPKPSERKKDAPQPPKQTKQRAAKSTHLHTTPEENPPFSHLENPRQRAFLQAFCVTGQILLAAENAGLCRWSHYQWKRKDKKYLQAFRECERLAGDYLESEAWRRAVQGLERLKFDRRGLPLVDPRTKKPYIEREYSDTVLLALLRAAKPKKYRDKSETKHTVSFDKTPGPGDGLGAFIKKRAGDLNGHSK